MKAVCFVKAMLYVIGFAGMLLVSTSSSFEQRIRLENTSTYVGSGRYDWTVFVVGNQSVLESISYVEYTLHPTFPDPVRIVRTREGNFSLSANGWGEFQIRSKVIFKDSAVVALEHWLRLEAHSIKVIDTEPPTPVHPPEENHRIITKNTGIVIKGDRWEWTIYIVSKDETLSEIDCVEYILHPTYPDPIRRVCDKGSAPGKGFFLKDTAWESFTIGVRVIFKNGKTEFLKHQLMAPFGETKK